MGGMTGTMADHQDRWDTMMSGATGQANTALEPRTRRSWITTLDDKIGEGIGKVEGFATTVVQVLEDMKFNPVGDFDFSQLRYNFFDEIIRMMDDIPAAIRVILFPAWITSVNTLLWAGAMRHPHYTLPSYAEGGMFRAPGGIGYGHPPPERDGAARRPLSAQVQRMAEARHRSRHRSRGTRLHRRPRAERDGPDRDRLLRPGGDPTCHQREAHLMAIGTVTFTAIGERTYVELFVQVAGTGPPSPSPASASSLAETIVRAAENAPITGRAMAGIRLGGSPRRPPHLPRRGHRRDQHRHRRGRDDRDHRLRRGLDHAGGSSRAGDADHRRIGRDRHLRRDVIRDISKVVNRPSPMVVSWGRQLPIVHLHLPHPGRR